MKKALITIGSTREYIDPVRFISNESSGQQGIALIKSLLKKNYFIVCLHGYLKIKPVISKQIKYIFTPDAKSMMLEAQKNLNVDLAIFNAAVADYRVKNYSKQKIKKSENFILKLNKNPDILKKVSSSKNKPTLTVGFAYETDNVFKNAKRKLIKKNCDYLILNYPIKKNLIFDSKYTNGGIFSKNGEYYEIGNVSKSTFANKIIKYILS